MVDDLRNRSESMVWSSSLQPFWYQGLDSEKTIFSQTGIGVGW